jgi:hypothetical protein
VAKLHLIFLSQEEVRYFPGMAPQEDARDEDAEEPSLEELIQAVLNSNTEAIDAAESLDCVCS